MELSDRELLAIKLSDGYAEYMQAFFKITWNKILIPVWFLKDNFILFIRVFFATLMIMILFTYLGTMYSEFNSGTQAGLAAFLIIKVWFSVKLFEFLMPSDIVNDVKISADRFVDVWRSGKWLKVNSK